MDQHAVDDVNRKLAILASKHGFAATARKTPPSESRVVFDAFTWRDEGIWNYRTCYAESELARLSAVAIASLFVDEARVELAAGREPSAPLPVQRAQVSGRDHQHVNPTPAAVASASSGRAIA